MTLDVFNVTAGVTSDNQFWCLAQAMAFSAVKHELFQSFHMYEFNRSYQTPGFNPNAPTCTPPTDAEHPLGDLDEEYWK